MADAAGLASAAESHRPPEITAEDVPDHDPRPIRRWLIRAEYVLWFVKNGNTPPLVTTGSNTDPMAGLLSSASTRVVYGGDINLKGRDGARFTLGYFLDDAEATSVEAIYAFAADKRIGFTQASPGSMPGFPLLARPFFNALTNKEDASLFAFPGLTAGAVDIRYNSYFDTGELNFVCTLAGQENYLGLVAGLRVCRLNEQLSIAETDAVNLKAPRFAGQIIQIRDSFEADNTFYGGQIGLRGAWQYKRWVLEAGAKVALGIIDRDVTIRGSTVTSGKPPLVSPFGLLALGSNSGRFSSTDFGVIPEASVQLGYRFTDNIQVYLGYSFLYWNQVYRPGDQIDRTLNPNLIPTSATFGVPGGPARPMPLQASTDFWLHALRVGVEFRF